MFLTNCGVHISVDVSVMAKHCSLGPKCREQNHLKMSRIASSCVCHDSRNSGFAAALP